MTAPNSGQATRNRVREVLLRACAEDVQYHVEKIRSIGWPAEVIAVNDEDFFGLRIEIRLDQVPVPVEAVNG